MKVGADTSRRVEVKLRPGPKRRKDGELTPAAAATKRRIAEVAGRLAVAGTWPSPKSVADADEGLTKDNVAHHRDALEAARLKWNELHGPHSHWKAPKQIMDEGNDVPCPAADHDADAAGGADEGHGAATSVHSTTGVEVAAPQPPSAGATALSAARLSEPDARINDLEVQVVALKAELDKEQRRIRRLEDDVEDRDVRIETLNETLDNLRDLNARLMLNLRQDLPVYDDVGGPPPV